MKTLIGIIEAQRKGQENTAVWMVGEQLLDIAKQEPACIELLKADLAVEAMSIAEAEKQIKNYAAKHRKGNFAVVPPNVAEEILRKFYGLPTADSTAKRQEEPAALDYIDLGSFF